MKYTLKILALSLLAASILTLIKAPEASAATLTVDTDLNPSPCTLDEAIQNINDQAQTNADCVETGIYGTEDTITIPEGTVLLTTHLPQINEPVTINGAGMGETIIDGDGQYITLRSTAPLTVSGFTVIAAEDFGIYSGNGLFAENIEVDGTGWAASDPDGVIGGIIGSTFYASSEINVNLINVYVHDFNIGGSQIFPVAAVGGFGNSIDLTAQNITVNNITNTHTSPSQASGIFLGAGLFDDGASAGVVNGTISNITVANIQGAGTAFGIGGALVDRNSQTQSLVVRNATVMNVSGNGTDFLGLTGGFGIVSLVGSTGTANSTISVTNTAISSTAGTTNCLTSTIPMGGTTNNSINSNGGNLSDDSSCGPHFTQSSDQNNVSNLSSTFGPLSDNGGYVPTIPLIAGSPAIDSGVTIDSLTTDARLAVRPQGTAYDSGAYESPYSKPVAAKASLASTGKSTLSISLVALSAIIISTGFLINTRRKQW